MSCAWKSRNRANCGNSSRATSTRRGNEREREKTIEIIEIIETVEIIELLKGLKGL